MLIWNPYDLTYTVIGRHIQAYDGQMLLLPCPFISGHMTVICYSLQKYMTVYDRHMQVYTFYEKYMPSYDGHMLKESSTGYGGICVLYDRHMTVYDGKGSSFPSHSCCSDRYKTCHTGHFCFCTRYMTSCA
jgi:hypothetical protein